MSGEAKTWRRLSALWMEKLIEREHQNVRM
jgi:hypothetical protein